jgi:methyl-accepting chemotaxis protein
MEFIMWKNLGFSLKTAVLVMVLIAFAILTAYGYHTLSNNVRDLGIKHSKETMLQGYKNELKDIVDVMALSLSAAAANQKTEAQVHDVFTKLVRKARFFPDNSGYFFIYRSPGTVFVHAAKPSLEGKNLINLKDPDGKYLIQELNRVSKEGGGYVDYWWEKPGQGLVPKLSYSRMIPGTPYWIGTGVYLDDINKKEAAINATIRKFSSSFLRYLYIVLAVAFFVVIAPLSIVLIRSIVVPLSKLTFIADQFSRGKLEMDFPDLHRNDEIGKLAKALSRLGTSTKVAMRKMELMRQSAKIAD